MVSFFKSFAVCPGVLSASVLLLAAQTPSNGAMSMAANGTISKLQILEPPVPSNPLELITGEAQSVQNADGRAALMKLLTKAQAISNVRAFPYDRKTSFITFGSTPSDGAWQLEDMSPGTGLYRWSAQGPGYSSLNIFTAQQTLYSDQPQAQIPVRLAQVRSAIFFNRPVVGPRATLRSAAANHNGASLTCVLLSHVGPARNTTGGRHWNESEYCIDNASGALVTYSAVPGLYVLYDYSQAIHFHDRLIPNKFTITQAGQTIIEAQTVSLSDPPKDPSLFQTASLTQVGVGPLMTAPSNVHTVVPSPIPISGPAQIVVLHGIRSAKGQITDTELIASTNSALNQSALDYAAKMQRVPALDQFEPGAAPQTHEVLMTLTFLGNQH